jgi:hypothetical protein
MRKKPLSTLMLTGVLSAGALGVSAQDWRAVCAPPPPVCAPQYTQVPVTEFQECKQIVQRPIVETKYVEQPVTAYRPVVETRTAQIPTVQYQTVTECQTRYRDCGRWTFQYRCRPKVSPCEYDSRPGLLGWLNRGAYAARMAVTPDVVVERQWVPNVVAEQVPVTRQIAIRGTREVSYQVTRMVAYTTTRRVAVNTVRMVAEEVTTRQPVTVLRTVPTETAIAMGYRPAYGGSYAFAPTPYVVGYGYASPWVPAPSATAANPDPVSSARLPRDTVIDAKPVPKRSTAPRPNISEPEAFREGDATAPSRTTPARKSTLTHPSTDRIDRSERKAADDEPAFARSISTPSAVRVTQWVARQRAAAVNGSEPRSGSENSLVAARRPAAE